MNKHSTRNGSLCYLKSEWVRTVSENNHSNRDGSLINLGGFPYIRTGSGGRVTFGRVLVLLSSTPLLPQCRRRQGPCSS